MTDELWKAAIAGLCAILVALIGWLGKRAAKGIGAWEANQKNTNLVLVARTAVQFVEQRWANDEILRNICGTKLIAAFNWMRKRLPGVDNEALMNAIESAVFEMNQALKGKGG